jgi:hypothetical protein
MLWKVCINPLNGTIDSSSSSWSSECANGSGFFERTSMTDRVPSPLDTCSHLRGERGREIDRKGGSSTHLVATSCLLSCNHMKSEMKSKCCVYARMAPCFRGSHSLHPHGLYPQRQMKRRLLTLITPSSSPVASRCEVGCTTRLIGALQGEHAGFINAPPAWCDVATHSCAPWRVSDKIPVLVSMILYTSLTLKHFA